MPVDTAPRSTTWTFVDGEWVSGNPPLIGPTSHAMWLGSTVFDGARWFDGIAPDLDLHCQRVNRSAEALGLKAVVTAEEIEALSWEGVKKFEGKTAIYIKPMYWAEHGSFSVVAPDAESTRFALCLFEAPMGDPKAASSLTVSPFRRPTVECMPTDAKAGCLYPNNARMLVEARSRGFDNALVRDMLGNVAETASSNIFMVRDGKLITPTPADNVLEGITAKSVIELATNELGVQLVQREIDRTELYIADEVFMTGTAAHLTPVVEVDRRSVGTGRPGPITSKLSELFYDCIRGKSEKYQNWCTPARARVAN